MTNFTIISRHRIQFFVFTNKTLSGLLTRFMRFLGIINKFALIFIKTIVHSRQKRANYQIKLISEICKLIFAIYLANNI